MAPTGAEFMHDCHDGAEGDTYGTGRFLLDLVQSG
jgi:hypothetical protein